MKDKLWFFVSFRRLGLEEKITGMFRPIDPLSYIFDPRQGAAGNVNLNNPAILNSWLHTANGRLTWQATPRNKFTFYGAHYPRDQDGAFMSGIRSYEASIHQDVKFGRVLQGVWKSPVTSRFLLEASYADVFAHVPQEEVTGVGDDVISVQDLGTGILYRAANLYSIYYYYSPNAKFAASYVTGAHAAKFGVQFDWGYDHQPYQREHGSVLYTFRDGVPISLTVTNSPRNYWGNYRNMGFFAQDQWTTEAPHRERRTPLRLPHRIHQRADERPRAVRAAHHVAEVEDIPSWKDISPRLGLVYDLFGNGKTALKATFNRYVTASTVVFSTQNNPLTFNSTATRQWTDGNSDFIPQEVELGPLSNRNFGTAVPTTRVDDDIRLGWGARPYNWEMSGGVQHQLFTGVGVNASFIRRSYGSFFVTDNLAMTPADYDQFCITAPNDNRLPNAGGQMCEPVRSQSHEARPDRQPPDRLVELRRAERDVHRHRRRREHAAEPAHPNPGWPEHRHQQRDRQPADELDQGVLRHRFPAAAALLRCQGEVADRLQVPGHRRPAGRLRRVGDVPGEPRA